MNDVDQDRPELEEKLSELEILRQSLEGAKQKEKEIYDQLLRLQAEFENFRKRKEMEVSDSRKMGREDILLRLITLSDALIQAEESTKNASDVQSIKHGLAMVHQQFEKFLKEQGLVIIKAVGEKFDPHQHEAIMQQVSEDVEEGTILSEIQRGYSLQGHVVR